ncbi:putative pentatricopeptide repeat-containing protein At3g08820 [Carya illinoinensis]|uniref:Pentatricopeptide repeat-containing protein n=1 Tax=Carya illinoinensis TaxID=32201 RepID=A0A8T1QCV9_CARIL|nr:putative pentatricopeptide repeat-containing protein At3g08820 [Carya illinoinensis]KAG6652205.1 hypothetical protein CIPAW_06G168000 [Carya illinoinensis]KAG6710145.1 hypothetical protein I3842_06G169100 [Carya illinoinensis]
MLPTLRKFKSRSSARFAFALHLLRPFASFPASPSFTNLSALLQGHILHFHLLQIHAQVFRVGAHQDNLIATRLIGQYPSHIALRIFHQLRDSNIFPFNAIIRVLAEEGLFSSAISIFKTLVQRSLSPNDFTFCFLLKACFWSRNALYVKQIHAHVVKLGFLGDSFVCNGLLAVYAKGIKDLGAARKVFDEMPDKSVVCCWTSLLAGYAQSGQTDEVLRFYLMMVQLNLQPEKDTLVSILSACSNLEIVDIEKWVLSLTETDKRADSKNSAREAVNTVLMYLFGKWGKLEKSREIFDKIVDTAKRSVLPWNAMIGAYVQNGCPMEALSIFRKMVEDSSCKPNHVTMVSVLSACAQIGDLDLGKWVHEYMKSEGTKGIIGSNKILATAFIDMYSKCGSLERAKEVFDQMSSQDVVSFNAMIMGLAVNGEGEEALRLFFRMQEFGVQPNAVTFLGVLYACCHSGLLEKGRQIFLDMTSNFSISPQLEHYACYIDLLARVGYVEEALKVVFSMPFEPNKFVWCALLGGCLLHFKVDLARYVSRRLVEVDPGNSAGYVMLANAFAVDRRWGDVSALRLVMREKGVKKQPGRSWISINGVVHEFLVGSPSHPHINSIYHTLNGLMKQMKVASA